MIKMIWKWFFGTKQKRDLKRMWPLVEDINEHFASLVEECGLTGRVPEKGNSFPEMKVAEKARVDEVAQPKAAELKRRAREDGESLDDLLVKPSPWSSWPAGARLVSGGLPGETK